MFEEYLKMYPDYWQKYDVSEGYVSNDTDLNKDIENLYSS